MQNFFTGVKKLQKNVSREDATSYHPHHKVKNWSILSEKETLIFLLKTLKDFGIIYLEIKKLFEESTYKIKQGGLKTFLLEVKEVLQKANKQWHDGPDIKCMNVHAYEILMYSIAILKNLIQTDSLVKDDGSEFNDLLNSIKELEARLEHNLRDENVSTWQSCRFEIAIQWFLVLEEMRKSKNNIVKKGEGMHGNCSKGKYYTLFGLILCEKRIFEAIANSVSDYSNVNLRNIEVQKVLVKHIEELYQKEITPAS